MRAPEPATPEPRPFPPGDYPLVVVGSGAGGIQLSYSLGRLGVRHAVLSADDGPGGMFRRWPFFQRLLSWTKPYAPVDRGAPGYERYDWNSLLADEPEHRALMPGLMDGTSYFPSRPEMERNLATFVERTGVAIRYGTRWTGTRSEDGPDGERFVVETTDGEYRARVVVFAVGIAEPFVPSTPGLELAAHYADIRPPETYAGRRVFIAGKQNSGFELAAGLLPLARQIVLASPSPAALSVQTRSLVGVRARYVQPFEDWALGGGVSVLDAAIDRIERAPDGAFTVALRPTSGRDAFSLGVDDVIAATGFVAPLLDLPALGVATVGRSRLPAQTAWWESATRPGIYFAGTITQAAAGLKKHGLPANSGAVHGARYNARLLATHLAETRFGLEPPRATIAPDDLVGRLLAEVATSGALWHQKAYLAWVATHSPDGGFSDDGVQPLTHVLDTPGPDAVALTLEADGSGTIYPVLYVRVGGAVREVVVDPDPFLTFTDDRHRRAFEAVVAQLHVSTAARRSSGRLPAQQVAVDG